MACIIQALVYTIDFSMVDGKAAVMQLKGSQDVPALAPGAAEALQAATRMLAGVALRSLEALDSAVTLPQFRLLAVLADLGPVPSGQAARTLGLDPSTVTRLADRMVAAGHVARGTAPQHRGVVTLTLTPSGRDLAAAADGCMVNQTGGILVLRARGDKTGDLLLRLGSATAIAGVGEARSGRLAELQVLTVCVQPAEYLLLVERVYANHLVDWIAATVADMG